MAAPANIPGTCCEFDHTTGEHIHESSHPAKKMQHKTSVRFAEPVVFWLLVVPLLMYGVAFVVAELIGAWQILFALIGFVAVVSLVYAIVAHRQRVWALPQSLCTQISFFVLVTLVVGFVAPVHLFPSTILQLALVIGMLMYGIGAYYDHSADYPAGVSSLFKRTSLVATVALIAVTLNHEFDVFATIT